jgi:hypothetical protein
MQDQNKEAADRANDLGLDNQKLEQPLNSDSAEAVELRRLKQAALLCDSGRRAVLEALKEVESGRSVDFILARFEKYLRSWGPAHDPRSGED